MGALLLEEADLTLALLETLESRGLTMPLFVVSENPQLTPLARVHSVIDRDPTHRALFARQIEFAIARYEAALLPFFGSLVNYVAPGNAQFDCPGHQGGAFFNRHPTGRAFVEYFGESIFRSDLCNADVSMGDLLIHEGAPCAAQKAAAKVYNADKTYFVLNGTSASNKVVLNAALAPGDLVLFDRNNHKSTIMAH